MRFSGKQNTLPHILASLILHKVKYDCTKFHYTQNVKNRFLYVKTVLTVKSIWNARNEIPIKQNIVVPRKTYPFIKIHVLSMQLLDVEHLLKIHSGNYFYLKWIYVFVKLAVYADELPINDCGTDSSIGTLMVSGWQIVSFMVWVIYGQVMFRYPSAKWWLLLVFD